MVLWAAFTFTLTLLFALSLIDYSDFGTFMPSFFFFLHFTVSFITSTLLQIESILLDVKFCKVQDYIFFLLPDNVLSGKVLSLRINRCFTGLWNPIQELLNDIWLTDPQNTILTLCVHACVRACVCLREKLYSPKIYWIHFNFLKSWYKVGIIRFLKSSFNKSSL